MHMNETLATDMVILCKYIQRLHNWIYLFCGFEILACCDYLNHVNPPLCGYVSVFLINNKFFKSIISNYHHSFQKVTQDQNKIISRVAFLNMDETQKHSSKRTVGFPTTSTWT